jgi:predicted ATPase
VRAPLVGRERELRQVLDAFDRALADRSCRLFTVLGVAGVGKSRLVAEVIDALRGGGTVAVGRCLPYGDGLTWWPLAEALGTNGLLERVAVDEPAVSRAVELLKPTVGRVARDEAFWVMRKALQALARRRPTLLVVDDLQWADSTFMDFLDHVVSWEHDAPLLLLVMARPELRDARPRWGEGRPNAGSVLLEPLAEAEAGELLEHTSSARHGSAPERPRASWTSRRATRCSWSRSSPCSATRVSCLGATRGAWLSRPRSPSR